MPVGVMAKAAFNAVGGKLASSGKSKSKTGQGGSAPTAYTQDKADATSRGAISVDSMEMGTGGAGSNQNNPTTTAGGNMNPVQAANRNVPSAPGAAPAAAGNPAMTAVSNFDPSKYISMPTRSYASQINDSAKDIGFEGPALNGKGTDPRAAQARLLEMLENAANGKGPSAAQAQLQAGTEANIRASLAQASSARGNAKVGAARSAIGAAGMANQQQANQSAMLRAQEMQSAYGLMGQTAQGIRGEDTRIQMANQAKNLDAAKFGIGAEDAIRQAQLQAALGARGQDVTMRGQDISSSTTMRGQDLENALGWQRASNEATDILQRGELGREANRVGANANQGKVLGGIMGAAGAALPFLMGGAGGGAAPSGDAGGMPSGGDYSFGGSNPGVYSGYENGGGTAAPTSGGSTAMSINPAQFAVLNKNKKMKMRI